MIKKLIVCFILVFLIATPLSAINIGTDVDFVVGTSTFSVNQTMKFSEIEISDSYIQFNNSVKFRVHSIDPINVTLIYLHSSITTATYNSKVIEFYGNVSNHKVWFNISGFPVGNTYIIYRNDTEYTTVISNSTGNISFYNSDWSIRKFTIYRALPASNGGGLLLPTSRVYFASWTKEEDARFVYVFSGEKVKDITGYETIIITAEGEIDELQYFLK